MGSLLPVVVPSDGWELSTSLGTKENISAQGLLLDILEQRFSCLCSEFGIFPLGLSCLGLDSSLLSVLDDLFRLWETP